MSDGQKIVFARSEVPEQFASASKSEQLSVIETGTICYFAAETKLRKQMTNADQSELIQIGREEGLQLKQRELDPKIRELETLRLQHNELISVKDSLQQELHTREIQQRTEINKLLSEREKELADAHKEELDNLKSKMEEDILNESEKKAEYKSFEQTIKNLELQGKVNMLEAENKGLKNNSSLSEIAKSVIEDLKNDKAELEKEVDNLKRVKNNTEKGKEGEKTLLNILNKAIGELADIIVVSDKGHEADFLVRWPLQNRIIQFILDGKKYKNTVPCKERIKLEADTDRKDENDFGMMVSLDSPIATKPHLTRDRTKKNKILMYLSFENMTEEEAVSEMRTVCTLLVQQIDTSDEKTKLSINNKLDSIQKIYDNEFSKTQQALREAKATVKTLEELIANKRETKKLFLMDITSAVIEDEQATEEQATEEQATEEQGTEEKPTGGKKPKKAGRKPKN
jgi:hypothetical protein